MISSANVTIVNVLRRLIYLLLVTFLLLSFSVAAYAEESPCVLQEPNRQISVRYINDGDTFTLEDGNRIRMIGINTPELGYKDKPDQPLSVRAREQLRSYLRGSHALIVYDKERHDKYGRVLAHVFDEQGNNIGAELIREGLGFAISIPPNLYYRECYRNAEKQARHANLGVWAEPYFNAIAADKLKYSGFNQVQGCIQRIRKYQDKKYFYLSDHFRLLISEESKHYFESSPILFEENLCLVATGWVYNQTPYRTMKLLHPDAIQVIRSAHEVDE